MTVTELYMWHKEQAERFEDRAVEHKTMGPAKLRASISRSYLKKAAFHREAEKMLNDVRNGYYMDTKDKQ